MNEETTYRIGNGAAPGLFCTCGHVRQAHGSNGKICAACSCKDFNLRVAVYGQDKAITRSKNEPKRRRQSYE